MEQQLERPPAKVLEILAGSDERCATFQLTQEDHTLGNSLRYVLARSRDTDFVGYSIPHPSEPKLMLRLQTTGRPAPAVFRDGLETLSAVCDHVLETFNAAVERGADGPDAEMAS